ncbi:MAG: hypothetical protein WCN92_10985, partial [Eubacteriales bacterium]
MAGESLTGDLNPQSPCGDSSFVKGALNSPIKRRYGNERNQKRLHLGNGCPQSLDRHDNILWRVIEAGALQAGLIPDGIHVSPALFRILHRAVDPARFWYTTDA